MMKIKTAINRLQEIVIYIIETKIARRIWFFGLAILAIVPSVFAILHAPIDPDSSYYLSVVERISEGLIPYFDFPLGYTPLVFYIMVFLKMIFSVGINYEFFLTIHFILQFSIAILVYNISVIIVQRKDYSFYAAILFVLASHWNGGNSFLLETPSLFFGLLSLYFTLKYPHKLSIYIGVGLLSALSFLCKQYGLGFLGLVALLVLFNNYKFKQLAFLTLGFLIPVIVCYIIWDESFNEVITGNYGNNTLYVGILRISDRFYYLIIRIFPALIIGVFYLPFIICNKEDFKYTLVLAFGVLGFMLQFYFATFSHYYLYIIPFSAILIFYVMSKIRKIKLIYLLIVLSTFSLSIYSTYCNRVYKIYYKRPEIKESQYTLANQILKSLDSNKTLYIGDIGLIQQYYLTNMMPPNFNEIGYTFGIALTEKIHISQINAADYVLKFKKDYEFNFNSPEVKRQLDKKNKIHITDEIVIYK